MIKHLEIAKQAAEEAKLVAISYIDRPGILKSELKDIKTLVDIKMNECIIQHLVKTGIPIISEESILNSGPFPGHCWIIDPLDGTYNFSRKYTCAGISIALLKAGVPHLGVVKNIFQGDLYSCNYKSGATKNDSPIAVSEVVDFKDAILATGFPSGGNYEANHLLEFVKSVQEFKKIRAIGSASLMLSLVAEGVFDVYYEKGIYIWDVAAGLALIKEAGGQYEIRPQRDPFKYEVLASNNKIFDKAKTLLFSQSVIN